MAPVGRTTIGGCTGVSIERDPRDLDLGITLDETAEIVTDERLTLGGGESTRRVWALTRMMKTQLKRG